MTDPLMGANVADDDPLALSGNRFPPPRRSGTQQWQDAIEAQRQRDLMKPSTGEQVADIINRMLWGSPIGGTRRLYEDISAGRLDPLSPEAAGRGLWTVLGLSGFLRPPTFEGGLSPGLPELAAEAPPSAMRDQGFLYEPAYVEHLNQTRRGYENLIDTPLDELLKQKPPRAPSNPASRIGAGEQAITEALDRLSKNRTGNAWVSVPEGGQGIYMRLTPRGIDIANLDFAQKRTGAFARYLDHIEAEAQRRGLRTVTAENIFNERLIPFFEKRGYQLQSGYPPSMVKRIVPTTPEGYIDIDRYYGR